MRVGDRVIAYDDVYYPIPCVGVVIRVSGGRIYGAFIKREY